MATREDITPELCRQLLRYEPETGKLYWRERPETDWLNRNFNKRWAGREAFTATHDEGYKVGHILNVLCRAHRLIWAIVYDCWPLQVDHIDLDKANNRLANLREVTNQVNQRNVRRTRNNTSGVTGVHRAPNGWHARIGVNGVQLHLGSFRRKRDAVAVRRAAEKQYGFSPLHGS